MADIIVLFVTGQLAFLALSWLAHEYGRRTGWETPAGSETSNWALRRNLALALGAAAMMICAMVCVLVLATWPARLVFMAQAALMAAAGASDLRKFHLPLPLSLAGIALGMVTTVIIQPPLFVVLFGLLWAIAVIALHIFVSKGSIQLGDHIATLWIALVMPLNGMIAILLGDVANVILARVNGLRGRKVAAAGPWLLIAAALLALPPYFAWLQPQAQAAELVEAQAPPRSSILVLPQSSSRLAEREAGSGTRPSERESGEANRKALLLALDIAGDQTASVALAEDHVGRVARAQVAAGHVRTLATYARYAGAETPLLASLAALADALARYDVAGVRIATAHIAVQRAALARTSFTEITAITETIADTSDFKQKTGE